MGAEPNLTLELNDHSSEPYSHLWLSDDKDLEAKEWSGETGIRWALRNPDDVEGTNKSWRTRFGIDKISAIREAVHGVPHDTSWLEVGCSAGAHMRCMQAAGYETIVGCDVNLQALAKCDAAVHADAKDLPFDDDSVDGVTTSGSLMHMGPHERMLVCVNEMARVARKWLFFVELFHPTGQIVAFGDLMPPAWIMPWEPWLAAALPKGWIIRKGRIINSHGDGASRPLCMILLEYVV